MYVIRYGIRVRGRWAGVSARASERARRLAARRCQAPTLRWERSRSWSLRLCSRRGAGELAAAVDSAVDAQLTRELVRRRAGRSSPSGSLPLSLQRSELRVPWFAMVGKDNAAVTGIKHTFCGAMAGAITKTSVAPLERVKIIMQVHGMKDGGTAEKLGIMSTARVREHTAGCSRCTALAHASYMGFGPSACALTELRVRCCL
jgi:ribosomal protein L37AE/L43A